MYPDIGLAMEHAWLTQVDTPGCAYDPTWPDAVIAEAAYIGIAFRSEYVREMHLRSRKQQFSVLITPWAGWPLLTGQDKIKKVMYV